MVESMILPQERLRARQGLQLTHSRWHCIGPSTVAKIAGRDDGNLARATELEPRNRESSTGVSLCLSGRHTRLAIMFWCGVIGLVMRDDRALVCRLFRVSIGMGYHYSAWSLSHITRRQ